MIKAGRAGSSPDGTTSNWQSQPLSALLVEIGEAVANLNTAVVGLDAVEKGHDKPESLDISWSPADRQAASRKARKFIVEAVLVRVFEALRQHTVVISRLPRFREVVVMGRRHHLGHQDLGHLQGDRRRYISRFFCRTRGALAK